MQADDSLTDVEGCQCIHVVVCKIELLHLGVALCNYIYIYIDFHTIKKTSGNHCLSSLSATRVTTLWLKQPTCFCSVEWSSDVTC